MCRLLVGSVVSAAIPSVVLVSVAQVYAARICVAQVHVALVRVSRVYVVVRGFPSVVAISVARVHVARICVARIYIVARGLCRRGLVNWRLEVEVWTKSTWHPCRRERRARGWRVDTVQCCEVRGSHLSRNCVNPSCISSMRRSWMLSRALSPTMLFMVALAFLEANCISRKHWERCSNLRSHPSMTTSKSYYEEWKFLHLDCSL